MIKERGSKTVASGLVKVPLGFFALRSAGFTNGMNSINVIAIFDVGKTNKKLLLFDEQYRLVYEESKQLEETTDEDGFACEDVLLLTHWVKDSFQRLLTDEALTSKQ